MVKNITISIPDEVYRKARVRAAEMDTSVSALVRDLLIQLTAGRSEFERRKQLQQKALASIRRFRAGDRLDRNQLHDRNAVR